MFNELDISMMQNALALAWQGRFSTSPNPRVGCVIARGSRIVGQGFHLQAGGPHAEVHALHQAGALAEETSSKTMGAFTQGLPPGMGDFFK